MNELVQFGQNLDFRIRRDHGKISYERRVYESLDDKSLSYAMFESVDNKSLSRAKSLYMLCLEN